MVAAVIDMGVYGAAWGPGRVQLQCEERTCFCAFSVSLFHGRVVCCGGCFLQCCGDRNVLHAFALLALLHGAFPSSFIRHMVRHFVGSRCSTPSRGFDVDEVVGSQVALVSNSLTAGVLGNVLQFYLSLCRHFAPSSRARWFARGVALGVELHAQIEAIDCPSGRVIGDLEGDVDANEKAGDWKMDQLDKSVVVFLHDNGDSDESRQCTAGIGAACLRTSTATSFDSST